MVVLHYIDKFDISAGLGCKYISVLSNGMSSYAESHIITRNHVQTTENTELRVHVIGRDGTLLKILYDVMPDIVHVHGCWSYHASAFLLAAHRRGFYTVWSPHGGLQPWIIKKDFWKQRLPRIISYQYLMAHKADMIHATGAIEEQNIKRLHWNKKVNMVKDALVTQEITVERMCQTMAERYQQIIDQHLKNEISISTQQVFYTLIKACETEEDKAYRPGLCIISTAETKNFTLLKHRDWRNLSIFAARTGVNDMIARGLKALGVENIMDIPSETKIIPSPKNVDDISDTIYSLKKKAWKRELTVRDMAELYYMIRYNDYDENVLIAKLKEKGLTKFTARLEYILVEIFGLEEGFLPIETRYDYITNILKNIINKQVN